MDDLDLCGPCHGIESGFITATLLRDVLLPFPFCEVFVGKDVMDDLREIGKVERREGGGRAEGLWYAAPPDLRFHFLRYVCDRRSMVEIRCVVMYIFWTNG